MTSTMLGSRIAVGLVAIALVALALPAGDADETGLARTDDGGCIVADWTTSTVVSSPATGCTAEDPCVHVNWTTVPPTIAPGAC